MRPTWLVYRLEGDEHFFQSQGAARGSAAFGDSTDEFNEMDSLTL